jgi:hypothetical protein
VASGARVGNTTDDVTDAQLARVVGRRAEIAAGQIARQRQRLAQVIELEVRKEPTPPLRGGAEQRVPRRGAPPLQGTYNTGA